MNKTAIKNFAIWARVNLIEAAKQRAYLYEINSEGAVNANADIIGGRPLSDTEKKQRKQLFDQVKNKGFDQVMEEAAYTWFNRFIALRFMEVNGYLPSKIRVFTNEEGEYKPEILKEAMTVELDGLDRDKILALLDSQDNEALYKMLLIAQCNALSTSLPYMFEKIENWTELLFPANLLKNDSIIGQMISTIPEEDWTDAVQIIGWLYQYYNSDLKDETFALLKKNVKITKERIPAATQLFTPDWIVRYMVENSLGRIYIQRKLVNSGDYLIANEKKKSEMEKQEADAMGWKYYLPEAEQESEVRKQLLEIANTYTSMKVEDIRVIDPCMGSGHILVYAFDVLMQIYTASGWSERDAAKSILENNLFGLDIDDRAGQLAYFAVMMKARKYNRRILNSEIRPNVMAIQDSSFMSDELIDFVAAGNKDIKMDLVEIKRVFTDAKEYGSILNVKMPKCDSIYIRINEIAKSTPEDIFAMMYRDQVVNQLRQLVKQAEVMAQKYEVAVTNPPYMGSSGMGPKLGTYIKNTYPDSVSDMFSVFIEKCHQICEANGYVSMITMHSWMFIDSYFKLRKKMFATSTIKSLTHHGIKAFEFIGNDVVQTCAFILLNTRVKKSKSSFVNLTEAKDYKLKETEFFNKDNYSVLNIDLFMDSPTGALCYWVGEKFFENYKKGVSLEKYVEVSGAKNVTGNNDRFLRLFWEVEQSKVCKDYWAPCAKGGPFRKYYGNVVHIIDWRDNAKTFYRCNKTSSITPENQWFKQGVTYSSVSSRGTGFRYVPCDYQSESSGPILNFSDEYLYYFLGFFNSKVAELYLKAMNPSINLQKKDLKSIPYIVERIDEVTDIVKEQINISKEDWSSYETTFEFKSNALIPRADIGNNISIKALLEEYAMFVKTQYELFYTNEMKLNDIFKDIYGFENMNFEYERRDVSVKDVDTTAEIKALISYSVGCMFGRYSLGIEGVVYAGGEWDNSKYSIYTPDKDAIIPICDDEYFNDDIVCRFIDFIRTVYGEQMLEENLRFIADVLGGSGLPRDVIRNYFLNEFFADHCTNYSVVGSGKRPIYWLFDSGKKNGFKCLIYMHRYQPDTIARIRTDYIHELQSRYRTAIADLEDRVEHAAASEKVKLNKQLSKIKDQELELRQYEEKIHHLADQMITIDLDDGVKVNYAKFGDVLAKIK